MRCLGSWLPKNCHLKRNAKCVCVVRIVILMLLRVILRQNVQTMIVHRHSHEHSRKVHVSLDDDGGITGRNGSGTAAGNGGNGQSFAGHGTFCGFGDY